MTSTPDPMPQDFTKSQDFKGFASPEAKKRKGQKTAEKFDIDLDKYTEFVDLVTSCLLYTSPSPRDKRQSRMPSSA